MYASVCVKRVLLVERKSIAEQENPMLFALYLEALFFFIIRLGDLTTGSFNFQRCLINLMITRNGKKLSYMP